ncbi:MAG: phosphoribosylglycinamide formyltransferase [Opitutaceae bacterium]|nr:phosphoribosylglycinamide formyltransferase [Opitutaceae bacterium]
MRIIILGSGRGGNAGAILRAETAGQLGRAEVVAIFSDMPDAKILSLGEEFRKPSLFLDPGPFKTKFDEEREKVWISTISEYDPDLIVLAGFMRVLKRSFIQAFPNRIINLHPSLLPSFSGLDGIGQAWRHGSKITGCTVHYVNERVDEGAIIAQRAVAIEDGETLESLGNKIHEAEHSLLPEVIAELSTR